jgi:hypothetical protein
VAPEKWPGRPLAGLGRIAPRASAKFPQRVIQRHARERGWSGRDKVRQCYGCQSRQTGASIKDAVGTLPHQPKGRAHSVPPVQVRPQAATLPNPPPRGWRSTIRCVRAPLPLPRCRDDVSLAAANAFRLQVRAAARGAGSGEPCVTLWPDPIGRRWHACARACAQLRPWLTPDLSTLRAAVCPCR